MINKIAYSGRFLLHRYVTGFCRLVFGGIFIFAGLAKLHHTHMLTFEMNQYQILPVSWASVYGHFLPRLEIILGVALVLGIFVRITASLSGLLVLSFVFAKIAALIRGLDIDVCSCFGPSVPLLNTYTLAIDIILLVMALQMFLHRGEFLSFDALFRLITRSLISHKKDSHFNRSSDLIS